MNRGDFQRASSLRVRDARALFSAGQSAGAYYIIGYAVECALKACVAKQIKRYDFPDKDLANKVFTHNLERLVEAAGLKKSFEAARRGNKTLEVNWAIAKDWSEAARYDVGWSEAQARDLFAACVGRNGVLPWIKRRW
jgi:hypothetical protein